MSNTFNGCYCSNYYTQIQCTNTVVKFGERCKLCTIVKDGKSLTPGLLPESSLWVRDQPEAVQQPPKTSSSTPGLLGRALSWTVSGKK
ncbi:hypothetical protein QBC42DRAFT_53264 [Cladorrhinum samala]|uniref:Uncharacterized protein n=1 Tax=Cladorrhinum samala TaxID=585594 RepID=A0AAV9H6R6_9PEZI|nr:hypothetical protein QBC42DRAFT_53264 [Cladorrhinum samala]